MVNSTASVILIITWIVHPPNPGVFKAMGEAAGKIRILDWGIASATLEEVFIKVRGFSLERRDVRLIVPADTWYLPCIKHE